MKSNNHETKLDNLDGANVTANTYTCASKGKTASQGEVETERGRGWIGEKGRWKEREAGWVWG